MSECQQLAQYPESYRESSYSGPYKAEDHQRYQTFFLPLKLTASTPVQKLKNKRLDKANFIIFNLTLLIKNPF